MPELTNGQVRQELKLRRIYFWIMGSVVLMYLLAAVFYADPFSFWQHALSELGTTKTLLGTANTPSALIVTSGMFITGRLLLEAARIYRINDFYTNRSLKSALLYCASLGAFIAISPNDLFHTIHTIGSAFLVGGIFLLSMVLAWDSQAYYSKGIVILVMAILVICILFYAVTFFSDMAIKQAAQKICLISLLLILFQRSRLSLNEEAIKSQINHYQGLT